jgi:hypothetical protein
MPIDSTLPARAAVALLALFAGAAHAQVADRLLQVEVVIFAHPPGTSAELPPLRPPPLIESGAESEETSGLDSETEAMLAAELEAALALAPVAELPLEATLPSLPQGFASPQMPLVLGGVARRLNTGGYRLLWHQAWVQRPQRGAGIDLAALATLGQGTALPELSGEIGLNSRRFLHLGLDLELAPADGAPDELRQRRRIRLGEEHYFDHPRIGAIAVIRALDPAAAQSADGT